MALAAVVWWLIADGYSESLMNEYHTCRNNFLKAAIASREATLATSARYLEMPALEDECKEEARLTETLDPKAYWKKVVLIPRTTTDWVYLEIRYPRTWMANLVK